MTIRRKVIPLYKGSCRAAVSRGARTPSANGSSASKRQPLRACGTAPPQPRRLCAGSATPVSVLRHHAPKDLVAPEVAMAVEAQPMVEPSKRNDVSLQTRIGKHGILRGFRCCRWQDCEQGHAHSMRGRPLLPCLHAQAEPSIIDIH